jgi:hypothetical protein
LKVVRSQQPLDALEHTGIVLDDRHHPLSHQICFLRIGAG